MFIISDCWQRKNNSLFFLSKI